MVSTYVKICDLLQVMDVISIRHFPFTPGLHISFHTKKNPIATLQHAFTLATYLSMMVTHIP
jgi:hypothetical protein